MQRIANYIGGAFSEPATATYLANVEPATGSTYSELPSSDTRDIDRAVSAAEKAFPSWSQTSAAERCDWLLKIAAGIEARLEELARAESIDTGKPLALARSVDIPRAAKNFRFFASAAEQFASEAHATEGQAINYTLRQPRGVAGLISPWNLPLYLLSWKIAPALAAGCTAVAKPSEVTPMTAFLLAEICRAVGLPPGVLNLVFGEGASAGAPLCVHPKVSTISFTGGTNTGAAIASAAGPLFKKIALELGGKNPNIVFADAALEQAIGTSRRAAFANQGQICLCGSRIYVERQAYSAFVERFVEQTKQLQIGDPLDPQTEFGSLVSEAHRQKVASYVEQARKDGGNVLLGGGPPAELPQRCAGGAFFAPTVITDLPCDSRVLREEIFGPVVTISPFDSEREVVELANSTNYGLASSIWTNDLSRAHRVAHHLAAGTVWVNCWMLRDLRVPFGGTKQSGVAKEGGWEAMRHFTEPKNVCIHFDHTLPEKDER